MQDKDSDAFIRTPTPNATMKGAAGKNRQHRCAKARSTCTFSIVSSVLLFLVLLASTPVSVSAWGEDGHEIVANVAWARLSHSVKDKISTMLNITNVTLIAETGSPLAAVANWADHVRHFLPWSGALHYIDVRDNLIPGGCHYNDTINDGNTGSLSPCNFDYDRDCPADICVAGAIVNYSSQLLHWQQDVQQTSSWPCAGQLHNQRQHSRLRKSSKQNEIRTIQRTPDNHTIQALKFLIQ